MQQDRYIIMQTYTELIKMAQTSNEKDFSENSNICMDISGKQQYTNKAIIIQHPTLSHITIPTYVAVVGISASQTCSYLCRDCYLG